MKISDALVIYFSAGAPFAVYFYFQNRRQSSGKKLRRGVIFTFLFWIPLAGRLFLKHKLFQNIFFPNREKESRCRSERDKNLYNLQKRLEKILRASDCRCSVFEFRETLERYAGLTFASRIETGEIGEQFFSAAQNKNPPLAAKCFERRNRRLLFFHQTSARRDFLRVLALMSEHVSDRAELGVLAADYAAILGDFEAQKEIEKIFTAPARADENSTDKHLEKDLWKPEIQSRRQPQPAAFNSISTHMQNSAAMRAASTRTRSRKKE